MNTTAGDAAAFAAYGSREGFDGESWWRVPSAVRTEELTAGSRIAFGALVTFTVVLLLSPQIWFPVLGSLRIAFVAACLSIGAHLLDRIVRRDRGVPTAPEFIVAFLLVAWAVITVPVAYWAAGSVELLTEQYLKAVAFFWLIGTLATTMSSTTNGK